MEAHIQALRINRNPLNLVLGTKRKLGLRIGYMEAALKGFYLNSIEKETPGKEKIRYTNPLNKTGNIKIPGNQHKAR